MPTKKSIRMIRTANAILATMAVCVLVAVVGLYVYVWLF